MQISYTKDRTKNASCAFFAKLTPHDHGVVVTNLERLLTEITEHSVVNDRVWQAACEPDAKFWGRGRYFGSWQANTMISVMGGLVRKLRAGGDPTDKQVVWINRVFAVSEDMQQRRLLRVTEPIPRIQLVDRAQSLDQLQQLREKLFHE